MCALSYRHIAWPQRYLSQHRATVYCWMVLIGPDWTVSRSEPAKLLKVMVGTTRFELATSPTPRVRSTRLSHVPTCFARRPGGQRQGMLQR